MSHAIGDKITNLDALFDFVGKEKVIGEYPYIEKTSSKSVTASTIGEELLNKTIYEMIHNEEKSFNSICIVGLEEMSEKQK